MKKIILILCSSLISIGVFSQKYELEKTFLGLKGKIDSVQTCLFPNNTPAEELEIKDTYRLDVFDENGHLYKTKVVTSDSIQEETYSRDNEGRILNYELITINITDSNTVREHLSGKQTQTGKEDWEFVLMDKVKGSLVKSVTVKANPYSHMETLTKVGRDGSTSVHRMKYDSNGNLLYDKVFSGDDVWIKSKHYIYSTNNQDINREYTESGKVKIVETIKYKEFDEQGNWTKREIASKGKDSSIELQKIYYRE